MIERLFGDGVERSGACPAEPVCGVSDGIATRFAGVASVACAVGALPDGIA